MTFDVVSEYEQIAGRFAPKISPDCLSRLEAVIREDERRVDAPKFARGDNPKHWRPCNRPLSPAELMYAYDAQRETQDVGGLREGESTGVRTVRLSGGAPRRGKRNAERCPKRSWLDAIG